MNSKPFLTPMWLMLALFLVISFIEFSMFIKYRLPILEYGYEVLIRPSVLLIETALYFVIRHRFTSTTKKWMWVHVCCMMLAFFVMGALLAIFSIFWVNGSRSTGQLMYQIERVLFWLLQIIGHVFFILVLAKSFTTNKST